MKHREGQEKIYKRPRFLDSNEVNRSVGCNPESL